jgi:hypothetical protein
MPLPPLDTVHNVATPAFSVDPKTGKAIENGGSRPSVASVTRVNSSATVIDLFTVTETTRKLLIFNDSTEILKVAYGAVGSDDEASATNFSFKVQPGTGEMFSKDELPLGVISGIWAVADGAVNITEYSE